MNKYPRYKATGLSWITEIPEDWEMIRLRYVGEFTSSGIDKKIVEGEPLVKIINYTDVYGNSNHLLKSDRDYMVVSCPEEKRIDHQVIRGDLIFTPSSETIEDIGLSALVDEELENTAYSYHVLRFRFYRELDHNYKKYLCNNHFVLNQFSSNAKGTTRQILNRDNFNDAIVFLPPLDQQKQISKFLDEKITLLDDLIEHNELIFGNSDRKTGYLQEYKNSLILNLVTGKTKVTI